MIVQLCWEDLRRNWGFPWKTPEFPHYRPGARSLQPEQFRVLVCLMRTREHANVLEIGVNEGHLAKGLLEAFPTSICRYIGVDVPPSFPVNERTIREDPSAIPGHVAMGDPRYSSLILSAGTAALPGLLTPHQFDLCLIDADHFYESVKHDTALANTLVHPGGLIIWHDIELHEDVARFCSELRGTVWGAGNIGWQVKEDL